jgi:endonuclease-8
MAGRWRVQPRGARIVGRPWLVLRTSTHEAVLWNGPVLELTRGSSLAVGPDILDDPPDVEAMIANLRRFHADRAVGDALLDQRAVAGIGNVWKAEALWEAHISPWRLLGDLDDDDLRRVLDAAAQLMRASLEGARPARRVYRRVGRPCRRCGTRIRSRGQGDDNRIAYWCPGCQPATTALRGGEGPPVA